MSSEHSRDQQRFLPEHKYAMIPFSDLAIINIRALNNATPSTRAGVFSWNHADVTAISMQLYAELESVLVTIINCSLHNNTGYYEDAMNVCGCFLAHSSSNGCGAMQERTARLVLSALLLRTQTP